MGEIPYTDPQIRTAVETLLWGYVELRDKVRNPGARAIDYARMVERIGTDANREVIEPPDISTFRYLDRLWRLDAFISRLRASMGETLWWVWASARLGLLGPSQRVRERIAELSEGKIRLGPSAEQTLQWRVQEGDRACYAAMQRAGLVGLF